MICHSAAWAGLAVMCEQPSAAQSVPAADDAEPIVVTAQRRPERPGEVPISLTALSGEQLERMQATDTPALGKVVPSLVMNRTGAFTQPYLRGVGKRSTLGVENSVATYVDGIYLASSIGALLDLRGVERVEILDGPQGTLFGRNTTGGVIQVVTRDPSPGFSGEAMLSAGEYEFVRGDAYLTGGGDRLAGNLAMSLSRSGGYGTNVFTGGKGQGEVEHSLAARSKWVWRPAGSLKLTLAGDYQDISEDFIQLPVKGFPPIGAPRVEGFRDADQDAPSLYHFRYGGISIRAEAGIGRLNFMSLTGLRRLRARYGVDLDMGPNPLLSAAASVRQDQFSQEFQLQSGASSRLRWLAGLYYIGIEELYDPTVFFYGGFYSAQRGGRIEQILSDAGKVSSYAAYGQATLPLGGSTRLTAGLRYTIERRSVRANAEQLFDNPPFVRPVPGLPLLTQEPLRNRRSFRELMWRASLDRRISPSLMAYASASRGFQSGGWNLQTPQNPAFAPERLDAFEAGLKYADRPRSLEADAALFYYAYSEVQVSAITPLGSMTTNATSADIYGLDMRLAARLGARTDIVWGAQLLEARFDRFRNAICTDYARDAVVPFAPIQCDVTGNRLPFAPGLKFNVGASREVPLGRRGALMLSGNLAYNSGHFSEVDNVVRQKGFLTIDASAEWRPVRSRLSLRIWALNLGDARHYDSLVTFPTAGVLQRPAAPRRFGTSIGYSF